MIPWTEISHIYTNNTKHHIKAIMFLFQDMLSGDRDEATSHNSLLIDRRRLATMLRAELTAKDLKLYEFLYYDYN